jgi:hypothetical protein
MTQAALAAEVGTVREVIVRTLRSLRDRGLIASAGRGRVRVMDRAALQSVAGIESPSGDSSRAPQAGSTAPPSTYAPPVDGSGSRSRSRLS